MKRSTVRKWYRKALGNPFLAYRVIPAIRKIGLSSAKAGKDKKLAPVLEDLAGYEVQPDLEARVDYIAGSYGEPTQVSEFVWNGRDLTRRFFESTATGSVERGKSYAGSLYGCFRQELPATYTARIPRARIDARTGFLLTKEGAIIRSSNNSRLKEEDRLRLSQPGKVDEVLAGTWVSLLHPWASNYAHWLHDFLPRVILAEKHGHKGGYLIPAGFPGFLNESLHSLGIESERVRSSAEATLEVEDLLLPVAANATMLPRPEYLSRIRDLCRSSANRTGAKPSRRVYISRKTAERAIENEDLLTPFLKERGFEILVAEKLSFREQVEVFSETEVLLGAHGAGMFNGLFMAPPSIVVEIFNEARWELAAMRQCRVLGIDHWHIHAKNRDFSNWTTYVPPEEFLSSLDQALSYLEWKKAANA